MSPAGGLCAGRVAIVTGAGRGIGREHALELGRQGARVVVNDIDGEPAAEVVAAIAAVGGTAVANHDDIADWEGARRLIDTAISAFGRLDVLINNGGFVRDRMIVSCGEEEWDAVIRVHLKGHFAPTRHAAAWWRDRHKAGEPVDARIINTSSGAGLQGSVGQAAYSAAKAGIAGLTLVEAAELGRYGVTANAIAPAARTRMTEAVFATAMRRPEEGFDAMAAENIAPLVAWLASAESRDVTGRLFEIAGGKISLADGWRPAGTVDAGRRWQPGELGPVVRGLLDAAPPFIAAYGAT